MPRIRGTPFEVGGTVIYGKPKMTARCQEIMGLAPWSGPEKQHRFRSQTLIDLVAKYHYFCPRFNLAPDYFRKDAPYVGFKGYTLMGHFDGVKGDGWHGVSWRKCINHPTFDSEVTDGFRRMVVPEMGAARLKACQECGASKGPLQVDHNNPTWADIMAQVIPLFTEDERLNWCGFNWSDYEEFNPPENHPSMDRFLALHQRSTLATYCSSCHKQLTMQRREAAAP